MQQDDSVKMQELDNYNELVEEKSIEIYDTLLSGIAFEWNNGNDEVWDRGRVDMSDFTCNLDIDDTLFSAWLKEDCGLLKKNTNVKLVKWCDDLARAIIRSGNK